MESQISERMAGIPRAMAAGAAAAAVKREFGVYRSNWLVWEDWRESRGKMRESMEAEESAVGRDIVWCVA